MNVKYKAERAINKLYGKTLYWNCKEAVFTDDNMDRVYLSYTFNDDYSKIKVKHQVIGAEPSYTIINLIPVL